jgi:ribosomal protein L37AE/L43A
MDPPQKPQKTVDAPPYATPAGQPVQVDAYGRPIVQAVPAPPGSFPTAAAVQTRVVANNANIRRDAQGNALCNKCSAPYPLPAGCTSWRCRHCGELNNASIYGNEWCSLM